NLKDLCLVGNLGPEFGKLENLKSILLDNNEFLGNLAPEIYDVKMLSEFQVDENRLTDAATIPSCKSSGFPWNIAQPGDIAYGRRLQQVLVPSKTANERVSQLSPSPSPSESSFSPSMSPSPSSLSPSESPSSIFLTPAPSPSPSPELAPAPALQPPVDPPVSISEPPQSHNAPANSPASTPRQISNENSDSKHHIFPILIASIGGSLIVLVSVLSIIFFRNSKVVSVKPWATGLSGQLQKAFVTGVPKLKRSELEAACEDFSNVIGTFSDGTVYKGTLSSGVEIAVTSTAISSREDWSKNLETQFRNKIDSLSKVNHKNFVNLIGYCEENTPFTRMMVFEYVPNGSLFEHLHIQEAEHLDWGMRLRIAMGIAYCLEHMHQLTPPIAHRNLQSCSVYLTEDYAAKISDFSFLNNATAAKVGSATMELLESPSADAESNVYSFGVILFEMITGRIPYSIDNGSLADWASDYLKRDQPLKETVDPTLKFFQEDDLENLFEVVKTCVNPDPKERPTMREVAAKLKEITAMGPDGATPKLSPLWWAELEILSTESS
ncbi:hypothetical protein Goarm_011916, partial [Gossypium armourianum]|nr:hypothetical protein [Gossypium armourianum]